MYAGILPLYVIYNNQCVIPVDTKHPVNCIDAAQSTNYLHIEITQSVYYFCIHTKHNLTNSYLYCCNTIAILPNKAFSVLPILIQDIQSLSITSIESTQSLYYSYWYNTPILLPLSIERSAPICVHNRNSATNRNVCRGVFSSAHLKTHTHTNLCQPTNFHRDEIVSQPVSFICHEGFRTRLTLSYSLSSPERTLTEHTINTRCVNSVLYTWYPFFSFLPGFSSGTGSWVSWRTKLLRLEGV